LLFFLSLSPFKDIINQFAKNKISINLIFYLYLGISFQFSVTALGGFIYDMPNFDVFTFISSIFAILTLIFQAFFPLFYIGFVFGNRKRLDHPEIEGQYQILYENLDLDFPCIYIEAIFYTILHLTILLGFLLQYFPLIQISLYLFFCLVTLLILTYTRPYEKTKDNVSLIIKRFLFVILSIGVFVNYLNFVYLWDIQGIVSDILLIVIVLLIINELSLNIFDIICNCIEIIRDLKKKIKFNKIFRFRILKLEITHQKWRKNIIEENPHYFTNFKQINNRKFPIRFKLFNRYLYDELGTKLPFHSIRREKRSHIK